MNASATAASAVLTGLCLSIAWIARAAAEDDAPNAVPPAANDTSCYADADAEGSATYRRRPGDSASSAPESSTCNSDALPRVGGQELPPPVATPNRWREMETLGEHVDWLNSYHGDNPVKADRPAWGGDEFVNLTAVSGSLLEERRIPGSSVGVADSQGERTATRGQLFFDQSLAIDAVLYRGDTVFRPPDWQWRADIVLSEAGADTTGKLTSAASSALQALWFEKHLRDASVHDDFDSARIGIQPLTSDFRGFLLSDQPLAMRLFGTRDNNTLQYNLALIQRLPRNSLSLNDLTATWPSNEILLGNLYWQDFPRIGLTSEVVGAFSHSRQPGSQVLLASVAPTTALHAMHDFDVGYMGVGVDGHLGWLNVTAMSYGLFGHEDQGTFTGQSTQVQAWFATTDLSIDSDWRRYRLSLLHASGDDNPLDRRATGFDGLNASPVFAGTDSSFFIHQQLALAGGTFNLKSRNGLLPDLRNTSDSGEPDFSNPGLNLVGLGADLDPARTWRLSIDLNELWLDHTSVLSALLDRPPVPANLGTELALNSFYRPWANQNLILRVSSSMLMRGAGYRALYDGGNPISTFVFLTLSY
jgi:hypothetical protein